MIQVQKFEHLYKLFSLLLSSSSFRRVKKAIDWIISVLIFYSQSLLFTVGQPIIPLFVIQYSFRFLSNSYTTLILLVYTFNFYQIVVQS
jgi:hypothetical protein